MTYDNFAYQLDQYKSICEDLGQVKNDIKSLDDKIYYMEINEEDYSDEMMMLNSSRAKFAETKTIQENIENDLLDGFGDVFRASKKD
ncbi:hypothetical protein [Companilactobacillus sp.]|uniref:hypothetical protein n=1 Tax=Companilactobacillus sp. TaxID=2767905 RepID=UPI0026105FA3|nr:hypothetical protein [Companilactobacillus sp.]